MGLYGLRAVGCGLWAVGYGLWAVGCGRWAVGGGLWAVGGGRSGSYRQFEMHPESGTSVATQSEV